MRTASFLLSLGVTALVTGPGCRIGYELFDDHRNGSPSSDSLGGTTGDGDGDGDGTPASGGQNGDGDAPTGGTTSGDGDGDGDMSSTGGVGGASPIGDFHVDSDQDPSEAGRTTLRDAILAANAAAGFQTITFDADLTISPTSPLPELSDDTVIIGNGTHLDFSSYTGSDPCLSVALDIHTLDLSRVSISNCSGSPLRLSGGFNHVLEDNVFVDNGSPIQLGTLAQDAEIGPGNLFLGGSDSTLFVDTISANIHGNTFIDVGGPGGAAVFLANGAINTTIVGNVMIRPRNGIVLSTNSTNTSIFHNTIAGAPSIAILANVGVTTTVENNIMTHSGASGLVGDTGTLLSWDYNLFFANTIDCTGCSGGLGANSETQDPLYVDFLGDHLDLQDGSAAIDAGTDAWNIDRNGGAPGDYYGVAPDMGAFETNY